MPKLVIPDTSVLIVLEKIASIHLLRDVYGVVYTTPEVLEEYGQPPPEWLQIVAASNPALQKKFTAKVDLGEASAMALYFDFEDATLVLDDRKARKLAREMKMKVTGTLGVLSKAKTIGAISELKPPILKLMQTNFRMSREIIDELLRTHHEQW